MLPSSALSLLRKLFIKKKNLYNTRFQGPRELFRSVDAELFAQFAKYLVFQCLLAGQWYITCIEHLFQMFFIHTQKVKVLPLLKTIMEKSTF